MVAYFAAICHTGCMNSFENALDDRAESFLQVGTVAKKVAESHCGVTVDETTHQRWQQLMGLLREVDTLADDTSTTDDEVLGRLEDFSEFEDRYPALTMDALGSETRDDLMVRTERLLKLGAQVTQAVSMERFIALRIVEGRGTAGFLDDAATGTVREQPAFGAVFMPVMVSMAVTANLLDSFTDAKMDYRDGKIAHEPNAEFYKAIMSQIPAQAGLGSRALLHIPVMREFALMSWNRLVNRATHGESSTTSLRIFKAK